MSNIQAQLFWTTLLIPALQVLCGVISTYNYAAYDATIPNLDVYLAIHAMIIAVSTVLAVTCIWFVNPGRQKFLKGLHIEAITLGLLGSIIGIIVHVQFKNIRHELNHERWPCESWATEVVLWGMNEMYNICFMFISISLLCIHAVVNQFK